jgi:hypothetical protein
MEPLERAKGHHVLRPLHTHDGERRRVCHTPVDVLVQWHHAKH